MMQSSQQENIMPLYLITSPTGKQYVGITTRTVNRRMTGHKTAARLGSPYPLHAAIRKYGFESMVVETLHPSRDLEELHALEVSAIAERNTVAPLGYNLTAGGEGTTGHTVTEEAREHLGCCMLDRWNDPDFVSMRKQKAHEHAKSRTPEQQSAFQAGSRAYWTQERLAERAKVVGPKQKALWENPEYREKHVARLVERNRSDEMRAAASVAAKITRASQTPERRKEIALLSVAARAKKRAEHEAYLATLSQEQADQIRAEARAKKSAETKAGRAAATPEQKAASKERYRQAALRRHAAKRERIA